MKDMTFKLNFQGTTYLYISHLALHKRGPYFYYVLNIHRNKNVIYFVYVCI